MYIDFVSFLLTEMAGVVNFSLLMTKTGVCCLGLSVVNSSETVILLLGVMCFCGYVKPSHNENNFWIYASFKEGNIHHLIILEVFEPTRIFFTIDRYILVLVIGLHFTYTMRPQVYKIHVSASEADGKWMYSLATTKLSCGYPWRIIPEP